MLDLLRTYGNEKIVVHWFSGDLNILNEMINEGYYFSIVPEIKYSSHIRKIVKEIPSKQLVDRKQTILEAQQATLGKGECQS